MVAVRHRSQVAVAGDGQVSIGNTIVKAGARKVRKLYGDRAYHSRVGRRQLRRRGIQAKIAWPTSPHGSGLGTKRWVVERTIAWLHQYRRLRVRYERRADIHEAFLQIAGCLICLKLLNAEESFC